MLYQKISSSCRLVESAHRQGVQVVLEDMLMQFEVGGLINEVYKPHAAQAENPTSQNSLPLLSTLISLLQVIR